MTSCLVHSETQPWNSPSQAEVLHSQQLNLHSLSFLFSSSSLSCLLLPNTAEQFPVCGVHQSTCFSGLSQLAPLPMHAWETKVVAALTPSPCMLLSYSPHSQLEKSETDTLLAGPASQPGDAAREVAVATGSTSESSRNFFSWSM